MNKKYNKWMIIVGVSVITVSSIILINLKMNNSSQGHGNSMMIENMKSVTSNNLKEKVVANSAELPIPPLLENKSSVPNTADFTLMIIFQKA